MMADYQSLEKVDNIFKGRGDMFSGVTIDMTTEDQNYNNEQFASMLKESLVTYKRYGVRGVWLKIPISKSSFVPIIAQHGFEFHHCFPSYIVMTKWLPEDEPNKLPAFATSSIGVGGFVINDDGKLLVVKERFSDADHWEIPGGMADHKEDIRTAAKREVLEETGIETEFLDEFLSSPIVNDENKFFAQAYKDQKFKTVPTDMFLFNKDFIFYSMELPQICNKLSSS